MMMIFRMRKKSEKMKLGLVILEKIRRLLISMLKEIWIKMLTVY